MRTTFERRRNSNRPLVFVTLLAITIIVADIATHGALRSGARTLGAKITGLGGATVQAVRPASSIAAENAELKKQLAAYELRAAAYDSLKSENDHFRALLHLATTSKGIAAPIVSSPSASPNGTFTIGAGSANGITNGALVLTEGGFVLGTVADTGSHNALVRSIFAPGVSTEVVIHSNATVAAGKGGGNATAAVPRDAAVAVGDSVIAPGFGERTVGLVGKVNADPARADATVYIAFPINLADVGYVYVVTNS